MRTLYPAPSERLALIAPGRYGLDSSLTFLARAEALRELGAAAPAAATLDSATQSLERQYAEAPKVAWVSSALGVAYALAGRKADAVAAAKRAQTLMNDALDGPTFIIVEAYVQTLVGDHKAAIDALELSLKVPSGMSTALLKSDPGFAPLRNDPRFKALLVKGTSTPPSR